MAAVGIQQPLYSLERDDFDKHVASLISRSLPGLSSGFRAAEDDGNRVHLKKLPDALANLGPAGACTHCGLNALEGCMVDICLACGAKSYAAGMVSQMRWSGSVAQHLFQQSIPYKAPKKRRSSQAGGIPSNSTANSRSSPASAPQDSSPAASSQGASGSSMLGESPWSSSMDIVGDQMSVFSLADAAASVVEVGAGGAAVTGSARDAAALDDFFAQLGDIPGAQQAKPAQDQQQAASASTADPAVHSVLRMLPDLSFLLADRLSIPEKDPGNFPPKVPAAAVPVPAALPPQPAAAADVSSMDDEWGDFA